MSQFIDEVQLNVRGGDGGAGCVSFRREGPVAFGGPNGGDGGDGGDVWLVADRNVSSLIAFKDHPHRRAKDGVHGKGKDQHGKRGEPLEIAVPEGTVAYDMYTGELLADLANHGDRSLYFGNGFVSSVSPFPSVNTTTGLVTFSSHPAITPNPFYTQPVTLSQTVTGLDVNSQYLFRFWTTGEGVGATGTGYGIDGFMGLDITGFSLVYLAIPDGGAGSVGQSKEYQFLLKPASSTTTFTFINWGHYFGPGGASTELVLDDVSLNLVAVVPEPSSLALLAPLGLLLKRRR